MQTPHPIPLIPNPGWKVVLTPRVPIVASAAVPSAFKSLIQSLPQFSDQPLPQAADFDWALHPGGSTIITGVEQSMNLTPEHLRASYEVYMNYGNSSSATIISVLAKLRQLEKGQEEVVACAFGPGIALEMMMLRRRQFPEELMTEDLD
jgi:fungal type III polyketide synthase